MSNKREIAKIAKEVRSIKAQLNKSASESIELNGLRVKMPDGSVVREGSILGEKKGSGVLYTITLNSGMSSWEYEKFDKAADINDFGMDMSEVEYSLEGGKIPKGFKLTFTNT